MGKKNYRRVDKARSEPPVSVTCGEAKKQIDWLNRDNRKHHCVRSASENNSRYEEKPLSIASGPI